MPRTQEQDMETIIKLLTLSENDGATEAEAATAANKAQELLAKWNLQESDLVRKGVAVEQDVLEQAMASGDPSQMWRYDLIGSCASVTYCRIVVIRGRYEWDKELHDITPEKLRAYQDVRIFGEAQNIAVCKYLVSYLGRQVVRLSNYAYDHRKRDGKRVQRETWLNSYRQGMCDRLFWLLRDFYDEQRKASPDMMAMVIVKTDAVNQKVAALFPSLGALKDDSKRDDAAYGAGYDDGKNVKLAHAVGTRDGVREIA